MGWVPLPTEMDSDGYTQLLDHRRGAAHLGVWAAMLLIASKCEPRGSLIRKNGDAHDAESLSRISRIPAKLFTEATPRLLEIGWLEKVSLESSKAENGNSETKSLTAEIPRDDAGKSHAYAEKPQEGAASRARAEPNGVERNGTER